MDRYRNAATTLNMRCAEKHLRVRVMDNVLVKRFGASPDEPSIARCLSKYAAVLEWVAKKQMHQLGGTFFVIDRRCIDETEAHFPSNLPRLVSLRAGSRRLSLVLATRLAQQCVSETCSKDGRYNVYEAAELFVSLWERSCRSAGPTLERGAAEAWICRFIIRFLCRA